MRKKGLFLWGTLVTLGVALLAGYLILETLRTPEFTPAMRGRAAAERLGCFACHGPGGTGGVPNPGADEETVPSWDGGTAMMYIEKEEEIREWILYGEPKRLKEGEHLPAAPGTAQAGGHEGHEELLEMPAYEGRISAQELEDLVAYFKAVAEFEEPAPALARKGRDVARHVGCFGCHGPSGQAGMSNPGSFSGFIPSWTGKDFEELVRDDEELKQWILEGGIERLQTHPVAKRFIEKQIVQMPAYRKVLKEGELEALIAYIRWLRRELE